MPLSKEALDEFKALYKKHYGEELSDAEVFEKANRLMTLYRVVYGEAPKKPQEIDNKPSAQKCGQ